jgi:hypothetical protein
MYYCVARPQAREILARRIPPVRLDSVELGPALQQLAQSTHSGLRLSMCPDVAASRVSVTTTAEMPLKDFVQFLAGKAGAEVDLARPRHGSFTVPFPHLYFARSDCGPRSYVHVHASAN